MTQRGDVRLAARIGTSRPGGNARNGWLFRPSVPLTDLFSFVIPSCGGGGRR
jgi:hypothetical protein